MRPRGKYRIKNPSDVEDGVWVEDGSMAFEQSESRYRENGYEPPVEKLPWKAATDA